MQKDGIRTKTYKQGSAAHRFADAQKLGAARSSVIVGIRSAHLQRWRHRVAVDKAGVVNMGWNTNGPVLVKIGAIGWL